MKYFLDHLTPILAEVAEALVWEGGSHIHGYAEQVRVLERALRELYPEGPEDPATFGAAIAVHAVIIGVGAAQARQAEIEARAERHAEAARTAQSIKDATPSDRLLERYLADSKKLDS